MKIKQWDVLIISGIVIGIIGCFSPWGRQIPNMFHPGQDVKVGTGLFSGLYTSYGLLSAAVFQLFFMVKRKMYLIFVVLISGLASLYVSGNWILQPIPIEYGGNVTYAVLYGAYVTLLGALIVSAMAFLYIAATAKQQLSLNKSKEKL